MSRTLRWAPHAFGAGLGMALLAWLGSGVAGGQILVPTDDPAHPRIRYADSLLSENDRCPVRTGKLNPTYLPVYVNGRPIGFC